MRDKELIEEKRHWLVEKVSEYCQENLDEEYLQLCMKLINKLSRKRDVPFLSGKLETWAAAVVYAIGQINFLFDKKFAPYASANDISAYFGVNKSTVSGKAKAIRDMFKMGYFDKEFSTSKMKRSNPLADMVMIDGCIVPKSMLPPEIQALLEE